MVLLLAGWLGSQANVHGQTEHWFHTLSTAWARPMAMGGAFTAVADHLPALLYNPANFSLYRDPRVTRLTVFFNPLGFAAALHQPEQLYGSEKLGSRELASAVELLVRGMAVGNRSFQFAVLIGEEAPSPAISNRQELLSVRGYPSNQYGLATARFRFAERVAIGGSVAIYYQDGPAGREWDIGSSYGVTLLSSSQIRIGVSYWSFPESMADYRMQLERIVHEAVNLGIAYQAPFGLLLAMDIRNLGEETRLPVRELHFGIEQRLLPWCAVRGGYFRNRINHHDLFFTGIGLIDQNLWRSSRLRFQEPDWALQYGVRFEKQGEQGIYYHALTFLVRL
jgi:hypothetical protein